MWCKDGSDRYLAQRSCTVCGDDFVLFCMAMFDAAHYVCCFPCPIYWPRSFDTLFDSPKLDSDLKAMLKANFFEFYPQGVLNNCFVFLINCYVFMCT